MSEETLIEDITSLLRERGHDVEEGQGEWPIEVYAEDGRCFGITIVEIED